MLLHRRKYCPTLQTNEYRLGDKIGWCIDASTLCEHERGGKRERKKRERECASNSKRQILFLQ